MGGPSPLPHLLAVVTEPQAAGGSPPPNYWLIFNMTQGNEARVLGYTQKLANCLKHQKTTDYKHLKFVLKPLLRRTNDDIDNVHSVHWVQVLWPLLQYKYSQHSRLPSLPMTSDPSRSQIRNSISRTLFGHLMDGDWVPTFLVGHYTYFSILVF